MRLNEAMSDAFVNAPTLLCSDNFNSLASLATCLMAAGPESTNKLVFAFTQNVTTKTELEGNTRTQGPCKSKPWVRGKAGFTMPRVVLGIRGDCCVPKCCMPYTSYSCAHMCSRSFKKKGVFTNVSFVVYFIFLFHYKIFAQFCATALQNKGTMTNHDPERTNTANTCYPSCRSNAEGLNTIILNLPPPTKFHGGQSGTTKITSAQRSASDWKFLAESSHQEIGRSIARDEAARWSCTADELEEISTSVADHLLMLMKLKF